MWSNNFSPSPPKVTQAMETTFSLKEGSQSTEFVTEDDLRACGLSSGEGSRVVVEGVGSSTMAILPALCSLLNANVDLGGGGCHCSFISSFCFIFLLLVY